ncbi:glycosyltransferase family 4 protein [Pigmentiphaga litoralis]|uniref:Glycosyltransferase involved in cell wall biosynthesis n=1 Tax=Pigmentiphaga litoralis TaxID=516702 RepID=A0A7Y9LL41_9BURK|nr:glycosyltransferase family 1 protein [Pigmentiphaga litoralis]NYE24229.1 glycosyltransferase involved in cell wall biosynthesis [Pigmentiphaga litoralis]NYE82157.1 glycosyltransferase involved in cell wall biosynthesis [Pigmentiphaga litoralis]
MTLVANTACRPPAHPTMQDHAIDRMQHTEAMTLPLNLTIPLQTIHHQRIGGTESALYNLAKGIAHTDANLTVAYSDIDRLAPEFRAWLDTTPGVLKRATPALPGPKSMRFIEETLFEFLRSNDDWVLYPNYFVPPAIRRRRPTAVLLHDIQYKPLPQYHSERRRQWLDFYLPKMFEWAEVVFLISEFERQQIFKYFGDRCGRKCTVIYNAIDFERFEQPASGNVAATASARPYVLTVCHHFPHKNVRTLLQAFDQLSKQNPDVDLYLVGKQTPENIAFVRQSLSESAADRVKLLGFVSDAELGQYYRNASLFALPSIYEGFGMPAIEAMGLGVPTLLSDIPSLREITFGNAHYVADPLSANEWAAAMSALLSNPGQDADNANLAEKVRAAYHPQKVAETLLDRLR